MKKLAALLAFCLSIGTMSSALAKDSGNGLDHVVQGGLLVTRVAGVGAALVLGVPTAIVRTSVSSWVDMTGGVAEHLGGKDCGPSNILASVVTIPASVLVVGPVMGTYTGCKNAIGGFNKPFNLQTFSLGSLED